MPKVPKIIEELIETFERDIDNLKSAAYNETQLRTDFVNPFWKALGWDMTNEAGYAIPYRDVKQEFPLKVGLTTKAPDYCFTIAGKPKFFLETKKPSVDVKHEIHPAYQLRRYGWSGKLPLSILTDFEEMAVYDCRIRPKKNDKSSQARINYYTFREYIDKWDEIESVFSRDAIMKGSFDKYVESKKGKRGTSEVDTEFLMEIEKWREVLARNIALRNPAIDIRQINFAVQRTIDRIIFLRMCEDRGIEDYSQLRDICESANIYKRLVGIFHNADDKYNSGLFHFKKETGRASIQDTLTPNIRIDDKTIKEILASLYYPESPYEFSFMPAEILGNVYEQFLGKVIRLTKGHQAKVEEKPEVRKAGGVYYTPAYIVDYIVENTVGKLCDGKKPKDIAKLKILDPACGSGSFLLGAFQFLLDYHLKYYNDEMDKTGNVPKPPSQPGGGKKKKGAQAIYQGQDGGWYLTTTEKKRILLNNIYGVDIDSQAVEVTKLSLLLKVLENENKDTLHQQLFLIKERALPDLSGNIKCGNSLIASDFYTQSEQTLMFDDEEQYRINAFDWDVEFPDIMKGRNAGFDAVIGNPPYVRIQAMKEWAPLEVEHYKKAYKSASKGNYDIYVVFAEKGLSLLNQNGKFGFILPHKFFNLQYGEKLREIISDGQHLAHVVHFGDQQVFQGATTYTCLMFLDKSGKRQCNFNKVTDLVEWRNSRYAESGTIKAGKISNEEWNFVVGRGTALFERLSLMPTKLGNCTNIFVGLQTSADPIFLFKEFRPCGNDYFEVFSKNSEKWVRIEKDMLKPVVRSGSIHRYSAIVTAFVLFPYHVENNIATLMSTNKMKNTYPLTWKYLNVHKNLLQSREKGKFRDSEWYRFGRSQNLGSWEQPKLMIPYMITDLTSYLDVGDNIYFVNVTTGGFGLTLKNEGMNLFFMCGLLNSRLLDFYFKNVSSNFHGGYFAANKQFIEQLPIRTIDFTDPADKARHDKMVKLVSNMLSLHKRIQDSKTPHEREMIQRRIVATDRQIDNLVYELYGLSDDEVAVVEGSE